MTIQSSDFPSAEFRFFIYDPEGDGFRYYKSAEDRDADAYNTIALYLDDGWDESVENVVAGELTHTCQQLNVKTRPPEIEIDEDGIDRDGDYWSEAWTHKCDYDLVKLT